MLTAICGHTQNSILTTEKSSPDFKKSLTSRQLWIISPTPVYFYSIRTVNDSVGMIQEIDTVNSWIIYPNTECVGKSRTPTDTSITVILSTNNPIRRSKEKNCYLEFSSKQLCGEDFGIFRLRVIKTDTISVGGKEYPAVWVSLGKRTYLVKESEWRNLFVGYEKSVANPKEQGFNTLKKKKYQSKETISDHFKNIWNR